MKRILLLGVMLLIAGCSGTMNQANSVGEYNERGSTIVIDRSQTGYVYYGFAMSHIAYDQPYYQILRKDETKKDDEKYLYPEGDKGNSFKWSDRYNYSYSVAKPGGN